MFNEYNTTFKYFIRTINMDFLNAAVAAIVWLVFYQCYKKCGFSVGVFAAGLVS